MKKRLISILLAVCLACTLLSITTTAASNATSHIAISDASYHGDGSLKGIQVTFDWDRSNADGRLVLMSQRLRSPGESGVDRSYGDFTDSGYYGRKGWDDWDAFQQVRDYDTENNNVLGIRSYTDEGPLTGSFTQRTFSLAEGTLPSIDQTYYVYLWTCYRGIYYPDALVS